MKRAILLLSTMALTGSVAAQNVGNQATAQYDPQRSGANFQMGNFGPPLILDFTANLLGVADVRNCLAFEGLLAVREGPSGLNPGSYSVFDLSEDVAPSPSLATVVFPGDGSGEYTPSFSNGILLLSDTSTGMVSGVQASTGARLWDHGGLGETEGRSPVLTDNLAVFSGRSRVVAAEADSGIVLWEVATSTLRAPLAMQGNRVYFLDGQGGLNIVDSRSGSVTGTIAGLGSDGSSIIASEKLVLLTNPSAGLLGAVNSFSRNVVWFDEFDGLAEDSGGVLAYNLFFAFSNDNGQGVAEIRAYRPNTGLLRWSVQEESPGALFGLAANNSIYYYNSGSESVRVRDAFSGVLLWNIPVQDVRGLAADRGQLIVQLPSSARVFRSANRIFFPHVADGGGQSTLVTLVNLSDEEATGTMRFFDSQGDPLQLPIEGQEGGGLVIEYVIPARGSRRIQTGNSNDVRAGWAQATATQPIRGSSIFQFSEAGAVLFEAGVAQAAATGEAAVFVLRQQRPGMSGSQVNFSTALAIANPFNRTANLTLRLLDNNGDLAAEAPLTLAPRNHLARFIEELFPAAAGVDFEGTLLILSDNPVVVTSLRSQAGFQLSSLPAGQVR